MANRCLLQLWNMDGQRQKKHLFPISFVSLNSPDFYTSHWPEKWGGPQRQYQALQFTITIKNGTLTN